MDMSFAAQALAVTWLAREHSTLTPAVYDVPPEIDTEVARLKLAAAGIQVDTLTESQERYLHSWRIGS
jgi:adenosylhomocysteinase